MLKRFYVDNFKSLINFDFKPVGLNLLIGKNNVGKTNLCQALQFLGLTSQKPLPEAVYVCGPNLTNNYLKKDNIDFIIECELPYSSEIFHYSYKLSIAFKEEVLFKDEKRLVYFQRESQSSFPFSVQFEELKITGGNFENQTLLENSGGHVKVLHEGRFLEKSSNPYIELTTSTSETMIFNLYLTRGNEKTYFFKNYLKSWSYYHLNTFNMRGKEATTMENSLESDGSNLSSVLFAIHNMEPDLERTLIEKAKDIEPKIANFLFYQLDPERVFMFIEDFRGVKYRLKAASDGTLRFLAVCYLILINRRKQDSKRIPSLILIEEPENGLHIRHLKTLFDMIEPSGLDGQFILTSHNPYFIDYFHSLLDGVYKISMDPDQTHSNISSLDQKKIKMLLDEGLPLGEMHFKEIL